MPISNNVTKNEKKIRCSAKQQLTVSTGDQHDASTNKAFLTIGPALPSSDSKKSLKKVHSTLSASNLKKQDATLFYEQVTLQTASDGTIQVLRTQKEKEKNPDRISLDRRGLTVLPIIQGEPRLRLLSLQHNLVNNLESLKQQEFPFLVFLDIYDNQLEKISCLDVLQNLRVLLLGKNRIKRIEGLQNLTKIEVLDLHGNQILNVMGLATLCELKVLNLAGNQIRNVGVLDLQGLKCLQELNLRRNRIKKLLCFNETPNLQKLFISNNELQSLEDITSVAKATNIKEISIDNNPLSLGGDCVSFLVSYLPHLAVLNSMQVTDQVRKAAMAWRRSKESTNAAFLDLTSDVCLDIRREEVISNARTNWELLRSQTKCLMTAKTVCDTNLKLESDFVLTSYAKTETRSFKVSKSRIGATKIPILPDKKLHLTRTSSQETENSLNTSSSNTSSNEFFRLPAILVPIINKMEQKDNLLRCKENRVSDSLSSIGPNVDSSVSSLLSTETDEYGTSEDDDVEVGKTVPLRDDENVEEQTKTCEAEKNIEPNLTLSTECNKDESNPQPSTCTEETASSVTVSNVASPKQQQTVVQQQNSQKCNSKPQKLARIVRSAINTKISHSKQHLQLRAATAKPKKQISPVVAPINRDREQGGDYLIEICGRYLNVYGQGAVRFIDKSWSTSKANDVTTVQFNYTNFNAITGMWSKLKQRFPNADHFIFKETNMQYLGQLNALAEIQGLTSLFIDPKGNPITEKKWESYAIYRLSHWGLRVINQKEITEEDIRAANEEYQSLSDLVLWSLPDVLLQPLLVRLRLDQNESLTLQKPKKWLMTADPALRSVVTKEALQWKKSNVNQEDVVLRQKAKAYVGSVLDETCNIVKKLRLLDCYWSSILQEAVSNTLVDYSQLDRYMKEKMQELN